MKKDDRFYLIHVRECIADIQAYTEDGRDTFHASKLIQDAVLRKLQIMVQSALRLSDEFVDDHPEV